MMRIFKSDYEKYNEYWNEFSEAGLSSTPLRILLEVLRVYSNSYNGTHKETIKLIIQPYFDEQGKFRQYLAYSLTTDTLLLQICAKIPEQNIKPQKSLAAIFQVMKDHTGIDIKTFYRKKSRKVVDLLDTENCMKNVILFLCAAGDQSYSNIFNCLPAELAREICLLMMKSAINWENNSAYHLLLGLLEGYCGFNDSIPDHFEKAYVEQIKTLVIEDSISKRSLFKNTGGLLFRWHTMILPDQINQNDGLSYIFNVFYNHTSIDLAEFFRNSPLINFFTENKKAIEDYSFYDCWVKMIVKAEFKNASQDISLLLSHPYLSATGKKGMINSLIKHTDDNCIISMDVLSDCIDLISSTDQELSDSFQIALENHKFNIVLRLFCNANKLNTPEVRYNQSEGKQFCHDVLHALLDSSTVNITDITDITEKKTSLHLIKILDYASTLKHDDDRSLCLRTRSIYKNLVQSREFIPDCRIIEAKFLKSFICDIDHFFHALISVGYYSTCNGLAIQLLKSKVTGINILEGRLLVSPNHRNDKHASCFIYSSPTQYGSNMAAMTALQACIMSIGIKSYVDDDLFYLVKELIAYDRRCLFSNSNWNNIFYDLDRVDQSRLSVPSKKVFNKIYRLINDEYSFRLVGTFFCGSRKHDKNLDSPISRFPDEIVDNIALLTMSLDR